MGLGTMMAGSGQRRQENDWYPTPDDVTEALLRVHSFDRVWEPACGDGAMVRVLRRHGLSVYPSDIVVRSDYNGNPHPWSDGFSLEKPIEDDFTRQWTGPQTVRSIITNPPFKLADQFIRTACGMFDGVCINKVAFVLKSSYWHAKSRHELFKKHTPSHIHPLLWRPDFLGLGRPTMEVMWCVWTLGPKPHVGLPIYQPLERPS